MIVEVFVGYIILGALFAIYFYSIYANGTKFETHKFKSVMSLLFNVFFIVFVSIQACEIILLKIRNKIKNSLDKF